MPKTDKAEREGLPPLRSGDPRGEGLQQITGVPRCVRHFSFPSALASKLATLPETKNAPIGALLLFVWRRERDSNPRTCDSQRFSRPPH